MERKALSLILTACLFLLPGCETMHQSEPTRHFVRNEKFIPRNWRKIAVLPFSGKPELRRFSGEWLSFRMLKQQHFAIIQPAIVEIELKKKGNDVYRDGFTVQDARFLDAEAVLVGSINIEYGMGLKAVVEVKLIDTETGEVVTTSIQSIQFLLTMNQNVEQEFATAAIDRVADDVLSVLNELAGENVISPGGEKAKQSEAKDQKEVGER